MKDSLPTYNRLSLLAFLVLIVLFLMQVNWLWQAIESHKQERHQSLARLVPELALAVNGIDHRLFHGDSLDLANAPMDQIEGILDSILAINKVHSETYFAIYQDSKDGIFVSNEMQYKDDLLNSEVKSCLTCIVSFSISRDLDRKEGESEADFYKRLNANSEFQYYSPVSNSSRDQEKILWFSIFQPNQLGDAFRSLISLFIINIVLLLVLIFLFRYLMRALSQHKHLSQVRDDFFNNMTHEFKTPLSAIRLASRVLRQSKDRTKNESYHQIIETESKQLESQIDKLLMLSLMDRKGLQLDLEPVDIHELIEAIPNRLKHLLEGNQARLSFDLGLIRSTVQGDRDHLSNCLCNLVENSLKYGGANIEITVSTFMNGKEKVVQIRDNGPGIPAAHSKEVFERFFRGQKENQYKGQGFGIGLSYVKSVVEAHGGSISLNELYEDGCEFNIKLTDG